MKRIEAIVKPFKLEEVKSVHHGLGLAGMTVSEVRGFGRQRGQTETYRGAEYRIDFVAKAKIEVVVPDNRVAEVVTAIRETARTGAIGDGKIFVIPLDEAVRIRTGDLGNDAL